LSSIEHQLGSNGMNQARVLGIVGWSGSGKTVLITRLIPHLVERGLKITTVKHAHHAFDVDQPGKDSYEHRKSGAAEVLVSSARRWVQMHEVGNGAEATLGELLGRASPCDLILVEGFKSERHPKLEVYRPALGREPLYPHDPHIAAVATDAPLQTPAPTDRPLPAVFDLNNIAAIAAAVLSHARPLGELLPTLAAAGPS
jgi:molybdopterin-guanine dinucleotide biosynthesis adapter protein